MKQYKITGMSCAHCQNRVQNAIAAVAGVSSVTVDLRTGLATVEGNAEPQEVVKAVETAGYQAVAE